MPIPIETLVAFALALTVAVATPGPVVLALVTRALGSGFWPAVPMALGMITGDLALLSLATLGLAALAQQMGELFTVVKLFGAAYLGYLGWRTWRAAARPEAVRGVKAARPWRSYLAGFAITVGNPKTILFYMALLPAFVDMAAVDTAGLLALCAAAVVVLSGVLGAYAAGSVRARTLLTSARARRRLNRAAGAVMVGAAGAIVAG